MLGDDKLDRLFKPRCPSLDEDFFLFQFFSFSLKLCIVCDSKKKVSLILNYVIYCIAETPMPLVDIKSEEMIR